MKMVSDEQEAFLAFSFMTGLSTLPIVPDGVDVNLLACKMILTRSPSVVGNVVENGQEPSPNDLEPSLDGPEPSQLSDRDPRTS